MSVQVVGFDELHMVRGDTGDIAPIMEVEREDQPKVYDPYILQEGDTVIFRMAKNDKLILEKECYIDVENNKAILEIEPEDTKPFEPRVYTYCFELITALGKHHTFIKDARFVLEKELG